MVSKEFQARVARDRVFFVARFGVQAVNTVVFLGVWLWVLLFMPKGMATEPLLLRLVAAAFIGDMAIHLGTCWFLRPGRKAPLHPISAKLAFLSTLLERFPTLNALLVCAQLAALSALALGWADRSSMVLPFAVGMHLFLGCMDMARLILTTQLTFSLAAFLFPSPLTTVQLCLAGVWFYSGMSKVFQITRWASAWTFAPIHAIVRVALGWLLPERRMEQLLILVNLGGVGGEAVAGALCGWFALFPPQTETQHYVLLGMLVFVCFMHSYIIVYIGVMQKTWSICSWNAACAVFALCAFAPALNTAAPLPAVTSLHVFHYLTFATFIVYPSMLYWGVCYVGELAFTYYSSWFGDEFIVFPKSAIGTSLPREVHGSRVRYYSSDNDAIGFPNVSLLWSGDEKSATYSGLLDVVESKGIDLVELARTLRLALPEAAAGAGATKSAADAADGATASALRHRATDGRSNGHGHAPSSSSSSSSSSLSLRNAAKAALLEHTAALSSDLLDLEQEYMSMDIANPSGPDFSNRADEWTYYSNHSSFYFHRLTQMAICKRSALVVVDREWLLPRPVRRSFITALDP